MAFSKITGKSIDVSTESIAEFNSTGIDDNATSTAITIAANNSVSIPSLYGNITTADNLTVGGDFIVQGNNFTIDADSLRVEDSLIQLASNNETSDVIDIGFFGHYSNDGNTALHTGFFRDASDEQYYLFNGLEDANLDANTSVTTINRGGTGFTLATLNVGGLNVNSGATNISAIFESTDGVAGIQLKDNSGNVELTTTAGNFEVRPDGGSPTAAFSANGNVGIGTSSPATDLHILDSNPVVRLQSNGAGTDNTLSFLSRNISNVGASADIIAEGAGHNSTNAPIVFTQGSGQTERMRIDSNGNLLLNNTTSLIGANTSDGSDNKSVMVNGGGGASDTRGAYVWAKGNEHSDAGKLQLNAGNVGNASIAFNTAGTERMCIDSSGNVGIGTVSPNKPLEISKTNGGAVIRLNNPDSTVSSGESLGSIEWQSNDASTPGGTGTQAVINVIDTNTYGNAYAMTFTTSDSGTTAERMRIDANGNVGIGTTPETNLHLAGTKDTTVFKIESYLATANDPSYSNYQELKFAGGSSDQNSAGIRHYANVWSDGNSALTFWTSQHGGSYAERMRIDGSGRVGIGTTSPTNPLTVQANSGAGAVALNGRSSDGIASLTFYASNGTTGQGYIQGRSDHIRMWAPTSNFLTLGTNDAERMRIDSSGNLALGATTASTGIDTGITRMRVVAPNSNYGVAATFVADSVGRGVIISNQSGSQYLYFGTDIMGAASNNPLKFITYGSERMRIDASGNVGIGTANPGVSFHIASSSGRMALESSGSRRFDFTADSAGLTFRDQTAAANRATIDTSGNFVPGADNSYSLGNSSYRWANVWTTDLHLSNKGKTNDVDGTWGDWTIQEGDENLFIINNRTGKKYKFALQEVN